MQHFYSLDNVKLEDIWLTIGSFDGVHRGHQTIIREMTTQAHAVGAQAAALTFHPHPATIIRNRTGPYYLTTPEERARLLGELELDVVITHPFDEEIAKTSAHDFMAEIQRALKPKKIFVGDDFALGRNREGDVDTLRRLGNKLGYQLNVIKPVTNASEVISSSRIRTLILAGDVSRAERMLGRPYRLTGTVIPGDGRGKQIGIPTANLAVWKDLILPKNGVYACWAYLGRKKFGAVTNIGIRPTFAHQTPTPHIEAHLINHFRQDIYGEELRLDFVERIRDEKRFPSVVALFEQIQQDIETAQGILS